MTMVVQVVALFGTAMFLAGVAVGYIVRGWK